MFVLIFAGKIILLKGNSNIGINAFFFSHSLALLGQKLKYDERK